MYPFHIIKHFNDRRNSVKVSINRSSMGHQVANKEGERKRKKARERKYIVTRM